MKAKQLYSLLVIPLLVASAFLVACDDEEDDPQVTPPVAMATATSAPDEATPTPAPTTAAPDPTATPPPAADCPVEESVCVLATELEALVEAEDYQGILDLVQATEHVCPGAQPQGAGGPFPLCEGATQGETREGYALARRYSEGYVTNAEGAIAFLENLLDGARASLSDDIGSGEPLLYSVSCCPEGPPGVGEQAAIIFSAIIGPDGQTRREVLLFWTPLSDAGTNTPVRSMWDGVLLDGEPAIILETGGEMFDLGEVHVLE